jgi:tRNA-splicing ligase RtcB
MNMDLDGALLQQVGPNTFRIEPHGGMRVPGLVFAAPEMLASAEGDQALRQVVNVATLPGIVRASIAMPDIHWGYGFPIGGVAAMSAEDGVVSPGGVGFDINCGVRLVTTDLQLPDVKPHLERLMHELMRSIPQGANDRGILHLGARDLRRLVEEGVPWLVERGMATLEDLEHIEEGGAVPGASADAVSQKAIDRGHTQVGSLGAGNHFLELQVVDEVFDGRTAAAWGVRPGQVAIMIHSGSRGFGHQTCTDYLARMAGAVRRFGYDLPDRQLACAPVSSEEGRDYLAAMAAAANFAFANRQVMMHQLRLVLERLFGRSWERLGVRLLYDVAHNIAKLEEHTVDGRPLRVWVHRKGATRAFGPGQPDLSPLFRETGQPVIVPGSMGTESWLAVGTSVAMSESFGSACHGAGRRLSRGAAKRERSGADVRAALEARGIVVRAQSTSLLAEEAPTAYKDVSAVMNVVHEVGLARKVARLKPLGVLKG